MFRNKFLQHLQPARIHTRLFGYEQIRPWRIQMLNIQHYYKLKNIFSPEQCSTAVSFLYTYLLLSVLCGEYIRLTGVIFCVDVAGSNHLLDSSSILSWTSSLILVILHFIFVVSSTEIDLNIKKMQYITVLSKNCFLTSGNKSTIKLSNWNRLSN